MSHGHLTAPYVVNPSLAAEGSDRRQKNNVTHGSEEQINTMSRRPHESARYHGGQTVQPQHGSSQHSSIQTSKVDRSAAPTGARLSGLQWITEPGSHGYQPDPSRRSRSTPYGGRPTTPQPGQSLFVVNQQPPQPVQDNERGTQARFRVQRRGTSHGEERQSMS
jgi:hypothetical protein